MNSTHGTGGDPSSQPLRRSTKFSIPPRTPDLLRRPHLLDFLHAHIHHRLFLISAAAGYGKTTLAVEFAHDTDYPVAWCRLDETDRDLASLAADLGSALRQSFPSYTSVVPDLAAQPAVSPERLGASFAHEIAASLDDSFVLVLDDFHLIEDSAPVIAFFNALLADLSGQAHFMIVGRTIPPLRIASLAARGQIAGLSEEHLRFGPAEVQALLRIRNQVNLPESEAEQLVVSTEGWITGILLTTHLMWQGLMASLVRARQSESPLFEYLAEEVLNQQPGDLRQFLLESAVLPDMEPVVCDAVLERSDSTDLLRQAESRRLFVSAVGEELRAYQYHHLFRNFLVTRLRDQDPERLRALQVRAAGWYAANGMPEAAVTFYILAGDLASAAEIAEANTQALFATGRHTTLRRWAEQLKPVAHRTPTLYLYLSKADTDIGQLDMAEEELATADAGFARRDDAAGGLKVKVQRCLLLYRRGEFENALALAQASAPVARAMNLIATAALALRYAALSHFALGQLASAEQLLQEATQLLQPTSHRYDLAWGLNDLALVLRVRGETAKAARAQLQALKIWQEQSTPGPVAQALNNVGLDLHMLGQYENALATYVRALDWAQRAGSTRLEAMIVAGQADVFADLGDYASAAELYRQAMENTERAGDWALSAYLCRAMARLDRWSWNFPGALEWLRRAALASEQGQAQSPLAHLDALRGIVLVEMGHVQEGRQVLIQVCAELEQSGALVDLAQSLFFRARAEFIAGEPQAAGLSLSEALAVAERVGYDQMLVSEVIPSREMLEAFRERADIGPRVRGLLERAEALSVIRSKLQPQSFAPSTAGAGILEVRALGQARVLKEGIEVSRSHWTSLRTRELFFFLVDRAPIARDKVLETFWPEKTISRATANLHQTLYRVRRALGCEAVIVEDKVCRLAGDLRLDYDVTRFEAAARFALGIARGDLRRSGALASALELYVGDYLADLQADWSLNRRQNLSGLQVKVLCAYAEELMNLTRYGEAREVLARALVAEPLLDELHERMLVCLGRQGRRHEVVDYYRRYREQLRAELGLDPPPEMRALYGRLIE